MTNISTANIKSQIEHNLIDQMINIETKRRVHLVPEAKDFKIMTACYIDNEFHCVSEYELPKELREELKQAN